jgi:hypothetical protein
MACTEYLEVSCNSIAWCSFVFQNAPFKPIKQILHNANSSFVNFVPLTTLSLGIIVAIVVAGVLELVLSPFGICTLPSDWHNGEQRHEERWSMQIGKKTPLRMVPFNRTRLSNISALKATNSNVT